MSFAFRPSSSCFASLFLLGPISVLIHLLLYDIYIIKRKERERERERERMVFVVLLGVQELLIHAPAEICIYICFLESSFK